MALTSLNTLKVERLAYMTTLMQNAKESLKALVKKCAELVAKARQLSKRS